jgi:apolipoprotein D and lipocalin family protein
MSGLLLASLLVVTLAGTMYAANPLATVDHVDLNRYVGTWYEIARYPNRFQRDCRSNTTAEYTLRKDGKIQVVNSCDQADGKRKSARGTAKIVDKRTNARLKVSFFWPFYGDYWVIGLDPEYRYAVVGEPSRKYLWILSRTPEMDARVDEEALDDVRRAGYDPARLIKTPQSHASSPGR